MALGIGAHADAPRAQRVLVQRGQQIDRGVERPVRLGGVAADQEDLVDLGGAEALQHLVEVVMAAQHLGRHVGHDRVPVAA